MLESENPGAAALTLPAGEEPELREEFRRLRSVLNTTLMAMLLLCAAVNAFLFYQGRIAQTELKAARRMVQEFQTVKLPLINKLVAGLQSFAQTHPDINPILERYGLKSLAGQASPSAPAPLPAGGRTGK